MTQQPQNPGQPYEPPSAPSAPGSYGQPTGDYQAQYGPGAAETQALPQSGAYQGGDQSNPYAQAGQYQPSAPSAPGYDPSGQQVYNPGGASAWEPGAGDYPNAAYPQQGQYQSGGGYPGVPAPAPPREGNFFSALFDFSFSRYITITWAKVIYVICIVAVALSWFFGSLFVGVGTGSDGFRMGFSFGAFLFSLLLGLIPAAIEIILVRLGLELVVAVVRTERNTRASAEAAGASPQS